MAQHQPLLLAVLDIILADEGRQEVAEPKQDRDLAGPKAGTSGAIVCPLAVNAGSGSQLGRQNRGLTFATKTDDESSHSAAAERRSGAMAESVRYETFVFSVRDSSHI